MNPQEDKIPGPTILIVEDEQIVAMDLEFSLTESGYKVVGVADTAAEAIQMAEDLSPDLILIDIQLPGGGDGIAAAAEIRSRYQIPVVFLTANANDETLARARAAGPYGYLMKPFRAPEVNATILMALHQHRLARELFAEHTWLRTMLGGLTDGVIATDHDGCVRYLNVSAEELTGCTLSESVGKPIEEVYRLATLGGLPVDECPLKSALATAAPVGVAPFLLRGKDGRTMPVENSAAPIVVNGRAIGAAAVFLNIKDRLQREREETEVRERLEERVHETSEALGQTRAELRALSAHLMEAQEEERKRVARELHDDLAQRTAVLELDLNRLQLRLNDASPEVRECVSAVIVQTGQLAHALRGVSHRLHPSVLTDLGIEAGLRSLGKEYRERGSDVSVSVQDVPADVPSEVAVALYRIAQQGLSNACKHAPGAPVRILLIACGGWLQLSIDDAGPGFDLSHARERGGLGLLTMQERARLAGGSFVLRTQPDHGTSVLVRVPLASLE